MKFRVTNQYMFRLIGDMCREFTLREHLPENLELEGEPVEESDIPLGKPKPRIEKIGEAWSCHDIRDKTNEIIDHLNQGK